MNNKVTVSHFWHCSSCSMTVSVSHPDSTCIKPVCFISLMQLGISRFLIETRKHTWIVWKDISYVSPASISYVSPATWMPE